MVTPRSKSLKPLTSLVRQDSTGTPRFSPSGQPSTTLLISATSMSHSTTTSPTAMRLKCASPRIWSRLFWRRCSRWPPLPTTSPRCSASPSPRRRPSPRTSRTGSIASDPTSASSSDTPPSSTPTSSPWSEETSLRDPSAAKLYDH